MTSRSADVLIPAESNTNQIVMVRNGLLLRGQRALYVLHCDYSVNWESLLFLAIASMANNCKTGECQKNSRQSDSFIVLKKLGNANGGKGAT